MTRTPARLLLRARLLRPNVKPTPKASEVLRLEPGRCDMTSRHSDARGVDLGRSPMPEHEHHVEPGVPPLPGKKVRRGAGDLHGGEREVHAEARRARRAGGRLMSTRREPGAVVSPASVLV